MRDEKSKEIEKRRKNKDSDSSSSFFPESKVQTYDAQAKPELAE